jgi:hypothetical protein
MSHQVTTLSSETWCDQIDHKVKLVHGQIAAIINSAGKNGCDQAFIDQLCSPYYRLLDRIYQDDYPVARAIENSDLVLQFEGEAVDGRDPSIMLIATVFSNVRRRVGSLAYAIAGVLNPKGTLPKDVDLGLTAYATGSLYLGFSLPDPAGVDENGERSLLQEIDPLYEATKKAIHALGVVSQNLDEGGTEEALAKEIPDPKIRDTALVAVQGLAPTGHSGIRSVSIAGRSATGRHFSRLTPEIRAIAKTRTETPTTPSEAAEFSGVIREIDLDFRRFELRRIIGSTLEEIRCIYPENLGEIAKAALKSEQQVTVSGTVERSPDGKPKLLQISNLGMQPAAPQQRSLL